MILEAEVVETRAQRTVLVIEDEEASRNLLVRFLTEAGYDVLAAAHGRAGLELFRRAPDAIDLLVLDIIMPHMDGDEVLRQCRETRPDVPAVVASGCAAEVLAERLADLEVVEVFSKPYRLKHLVSRIDEILSAASTAQ